MRVSDFHHQLNLVHSMRPYSRTGPDASPIRSRYYHRAATAAPASTTAYEDTSYRSPGKDGAGVSTPTANVTTAASTAVAGVKCCSGGGVVGVRGGGGGAVMALPGGGGGSRGEEMGDWGGGGDEGGYDQHGQSHQPEGAVDEEVEPFLRQALAENRYVFVRV